MAQESNTTLANRPVKEVYAVSRLVREARGVLEGSFLLIWVEGELSNLAMPASGHIYFTLKDEVAQVRCAMFKMRNRQLRFTPKNGLHVLLRARVTLYEGRGEFQLVVEHMEEAGSGALQRAYEALKHRLGEAGLFDQAHKKPLPTLPQTIGVVSSPDGAAVHDIVTVLKRRFAIANIIIYPVVVQGSDSAQQITDAINSANKHQQCDVLIVSRGGGSLEDLWSFNNESVARAIFASELPVISAVGHEIDFTIADFVADVRAATPSIAAEISVPDSVDLVDKLQHYQRQLNRLIMHELQQKRQRLDHCAVRLTHPLASIAAQLDKLAMLADRLHQQMKQTLPQLQFHYATIVKRMQLISPLATIHRQQKYGQQVQQRLHSTMQQRCQNEQLQLQQQIRTLAAVSPLSTLERGYSITTLVETDQVIQQSDQISLNQHINVRLQQGQLRCQIKEIKHDQRL